MGFLETSVVVYLRNLYYPEGFDFPLAPVSDLIFITELGRELSTIIMLLAVGFLAGKTFIERFSFFLFGFAVWDLMYYVFLKVLLDWPDSFLTWDVLFLIPIPWFGPVIAPCILSFLMILFFLIMVRLKAQGIIMRLDWMDWLIMVISSVLVVYSFIYDSLNIIINSGFSSTKTQEEINQFIPDFYPWQILFFSVLMLLVDFIWIYLKNQKNNLRHCLHDILSRVNKKQKTRCF
ncbi:MAG: hypothetical protein A2W91_14450 [Bacteroidetes bacterium GWF2_38_335]|nr:MAG: hypothetical protein A2W91_14450 [Bacteroidetes bacterium GWF2_38_335]OFY79340.1 MAG: hypothetical protein A2281_16705 [Bacteroidetes bacterium RIFOXYA12_FULL_38_20]HBS85599.1 hypothetical protein [Bacteroidales bacterium]